MESLFGDKLVVISSYFHSGIFYTWYKDLKEIHVSVYSQVIDIWWA